MAQEALARVDLADRSTIVRTSSPADSTSEWLSRAPWSIGPSIILADEPTGNLDSATGSEILALFDRLYQEGNTLVLVTHDQRVAGHAHRILTIEDGAIRRDERIK